MKYVSKVVPALVAVVVTVGLASCGDSHDEYAEAETVSGQFRLVPKAPPGYDALAGEATLERADGGTTVSLRVTGLPPSGEYVAHLHSGGCEEADPGGPHFKFDPDGSDEPPNEIHLGFSSKADGAGRASASSKREVPVGEAGSVVLHQAEDEQKTAAGISAEGEALLVHEGHHHGDQSQPEKIACAELEGGRPHGASHAESAGMGGKVTTIVVRDGEPVGGVRELEYDAGDEIRFEVDSDVADEVHVHGYDLMEEVPAGGTVSFDFPAEIEGIFEVELEGRKTQIAEITVNP